jgi:hypothetical protein
MSSYNVDIFTRPEIEEIFQKYLEKFKISNIHSIIDNQSNNKKNLLLLTFIRDFQNFIIDFDLLISLIGIIWIIDPDKFDPLKQTEVEMLCFKSLELQWAIRTNPNRVTATLLSLINYYTANKKSIDELDSIKKL